MEKDLQNLNQIFNKKFFRIPDYQRGYSWGKQQLEDFWEDLELLSNTGYHYTGMLTYEKMKSPKDEDDVKLKTEYSYEPYYIVDGQQRFTTISILLKCILNKFDDDELIIDETKKDWEKKYLYKEIEGYEYYLFGYETDNPSNYYFKNKILEKEASDEENKQETIYTHNLSFAKKYFIKHLKDFDKVALKKLFRKLTNQLKFNIYEVDDDIEVFVTFETMNNRGKSLSKLELLKNRLIYLSTKISDDDGVDKVKLRTEINDTWKTIYNSLGKNINNILDDDDFLYNHWIMYFAGYKRNVGSEYSKFLLNEKFTIRDILNGKLSGKFIKDYVMSLRISIKSYFYINNPTFKNELINKYPQSTIYLEKLNRLSFSSFLPLIMSTINKNISDKELIKILKTIEGFVFVIFKLNRYISTYKNSKFFNYANKYEQGNISLEEINKEIKELQEESFDMTYFKNYINKRFNNGKGYYDWYGELRYFLFEYELHLKNEVGNNEDKIDWENFTNLKKDSLSIEHIFPQSKAKTKELQLLCHSLGNLVPLSVSINSKLQDKDFKIKKEERFKNGSLSERELCEYDDWNKEQIKERGLNLLNFMSERWNIKLDDEELNLNILGFN